MANDMTGDARINFRLPPNLKQTIEQAAALQGQTVSDFAVSTLTRSARAVIEEHDRTVLSNRDRDRFIALVDETHAKPKKALRSAARRYKKKRG